MTPTKLVITDPELIAKLASASGVVEFHGPDGQPIQCAEMIGLDRLPTRSQSPVPVKELEAARSERVRQVKLRDHWKQVEQGTSS